MGLIIHPFLFGEIVFIENRLSCFMANRRRIQNIPVKKNDIEVDIRSYAKYLLRRGTILEKKRVIIMSKKQVNVKK